MRQLADFSLWPPQFTPNYGITPGYYQWPSPPVSLLAPHKCPVCGGRGTVPHGFYNINMGPLASTTGGTQPEECRSCNGKGVIR